MEHTDVSRHLRSDVGAGGALLYRRPPNGSVTQLRRGNRCHWRRGAPLAATNEMSAGAMCKRRDATALGRLPSRLGQRANERPAVSCCDELGGAPRDVRIIFRVVRVELVGWLSM